MSQINLISPTTFTAATLITDEIQALNGSADSIPQLSKSGSETASIAFEIRSVLGAFLLPRMTTTQRLALTPLNGMEVYDLTLNEIYSYENSAWVGTGAGGTVTSLTSGSNIVLSPSTITTTGSIALSATPSGLTSIGVGNLSVSGNTITTTNSGTITLTGLVTYTQGTTGFVDNVHVLSSALSTYQILVTDSVVIPNTTSHAMLLSLPTNPVSGETFRIVDGFGNAGTNAISIQGSTPINGTLPIENASQVAVGSEPFMVAITPNGNYAFVPNNGAATVSVLTGVDTNAPSVLTTLTVGNAPEYICITPNGLYGYVVNSTDGTATVITGASGGSPSSGTTIASIGVKPEFCVCSPNGNNVLVLDGNSTNCYWIGNASGGSPSLVKTLALTGSTNAVWGLFTPSGNYAYICGGGGIIYVIQNASNSTAPLPSILTTFNIGGGPSFNSIAITSDGNYVYACNNPGQQVAVIQNASSGSPTLLTTLNLGVAALGIAITPDNNFAYVTNFNNAPATVTVIRGVSTNAPTVMTTITLPSGSDPGDVIITPNGNYAYVANDGSNGTNAISVIQNCMTSNPTVLTTLDAGGTPFELSITPDGQFIYVVDNSANEITQIENTSLITSIISTNYQGKTAIYTGSAWNVF